MKVLVQKDRSMFFKKILGLSGLRIIYAFFGLIYSILQVRFFGTSRVVEIFFVANAVAYLVTSLTQSGQLSEFFLPIYLGIKEKNGKEAAYRAFSVLINRFAVFLTIMLILFYFFSPFIVSLMAPGFSAIDKALAVKMFRLFLIFLELQFINSFIDVTLNAEKIFGRVEWAAILNSVISLILLILFYKTLGVWVLVLTLFVGKLSEFIITIFFVKKVGIKYSLIWSEKNFDAKAFFKLMFTTSGYVVATQIYNIVFTAMATLLPQGTYAIFKYVQQVSTKASGILLAPLSTVFFSHFSGNIASGKSNLENKMTSPILYSTILGLSFISLVALLGNQIIHILWRSKATSEYFLGIGYWMLIINFVAFTISAIGSIYRKAAVSLDNGKRIYQSWILVQFITALSSYLLIRKIGWLGLSAVSLLNTAMMVGTSIWVAGKSGIELKKTIQMKKIVSIVVSCILFLGMTVILNSFLQNNLPIFYIVIIKVSCALLLAFILLFSRHKNLLNKLNSFLRSFFRVSSYLDKPVL